MPLNKKGRKIMKSMRKTYGAKKAKQVFYASRNKGVISEVDPESSYRGYLKKNKKGVKYSKSK
jgi:hypothetical protein